jgi:hypothetical protein
MVCRYVCRFVETTKQKTHTMTTTQKTQMEHFKAAKQIALNISNGMMMRASYNDAPTNYSGAKTADGRMWVIGDTSADIQNPDSMIHGKPAREIFGDFTVMSK